MGISFAAALKIAASAKLSDSNKGKVLTETRNGTVIAIFTLPPTGDLTTADLAEVTSFILDRVDELVAITPGITDAALLAALLANIKPIRSYRPDFTNGLQRIGGVQ